ncbi:DUF5060 domain-containing protein [bacterium]|nr:DUF5060 domain-containing protein [bacterium]
MRYTAVIYFCSFLFSLSFLKCSNPAIKGSARRTSRPVQYEKAEFEISVQAPFSNAYDCRDIAVDMILLSPSGKSLTLPCYFEKGCDSLSQWKARFTPQESGQYKYRFHVDGDKRSLKNTGWKTFPVAPSPGDGFLRVHDDWTLRFDSGKPFRGIGENVGWEARSFEDPKYTFETILGSLAQNGANFIRSWMCPWSLPLEWKKVSQTDRYSDSDEYFNPDGIRRMDAFIRLADSLGIYIMLALDSHNALIENNQWEIHNYNIVNGGPARTPVEFFTLDESRAMYKNRLRYLVARWGYSPAIAAWEFFNEIDNAVFTSSPENRERIPQAAVTAWHDEMSRYLKSIDPYGHIVTTSVSHRDIAGLNDLESLDINQKHIYKHTDLIRPEILKYTAAHGKPYIIGEFAYEWNWELDFNTILEELDDDFRRGLWYGLFSPTPVLPMTWWWEHFDARGMIPYFQAVREISDRMLEAGKGSFDTTTVEAAGLESHAVRCGETVFAFIRNGSKRKLSADVSFPEIAGGDPGYRVGEYRPDERKTLAIDDASSKNGLLQVPGISLDPGEIIILILSPL